MLRIRDQALQRRRERNPEEDLDAEPRFTPQLERFRDEMLARIGEGSLVGDEEEDDDIIQTNITVADEEFPPIRRADVIDLERMSEERIVEIN